MLAIGAAECVAASWVLGHKTSVDRVGLEATKWFEGTAAFAVMRATKRTGFNLIPGRGGVGCSGCRG